MPNDTVRIKFDVENSKAVNAALLEKNQLLRQIESSAKATSGALDLVTRGGGGAGGNDSLVGRFDRAAQALDNAKKKTTSLNTELGKVHGTSEIGASAFALLGIRGGESISLIIRQTQEMGLTLQQVLNSPTIGFIALAAGGIIFGRVVSGIVDDLRGMEETSRLVNQSFAHLNLTGLSGGASELSSALDKLSTAQRELSLLDTHGKVGLLGRLLGDRESDEKIGEAQQELDTVRKRKQIFGSDIAGKILPFLAGPDSGDLDAAFQKLARARGGAASELDLDQRIKLATQKVNAFQLELFKTGDRENIFDQTARSLRDLAREAGGLGELRTFIQTSLKSAEQGDLDPRAFQQQVDALRERLQERDRNSKLEQAARTSQSALNTSANFQTGDAGRQTSALERSIRSNPLEKLFFDAQARMNQFRQQFPLVTKDVYDKFKVASDQVLNLELFKTNLSERMGLRNLAGNIQRLQAAGSFSDRDISQSEQSRLAQAKVKEAQFFGSLDDVRSAQAGLLGRGAELEAQARQAHFNGQFVREAELQNEAERFNRTERGRLTEQDIKQREILALKGELGGTSDPEKQRFVLDKLLEVTSNIGELSGEDRELRLKSLQQRLALGEARQRVLIEIKNGAGDSATVTQDSLGPEPSPGFGNGFFGRGFNAAAESSGVAFGASDPNNRIGN